MIPPVQVLRGVRELRRLLRERTFDLRGLDLAGFRRWLGGHLVRWEKDPVFAQRARIRDLGRLHPRLRLLEQEYRRAAVADAAAPQASRLFRLERELTGSDRAITGLTAALKRAAAEKRPKLQQKLQAFQARQQALRQEQAELIRSSPERQALQRVSEELQRLRSAIGIDREEARLEKLLKQQGRRSGHSGESFERLALTLTDSYVVPDLLRGGKGCEATERLRLLRGVTLGAARTEFDQLVVRRPRHTGRPVEVLAAVEVKRNINDLAHGFHQRQADLAWLTGDTVKYDPGSYRTRHFPAGHFDREAVHQEDGEPFVFARSSFRHFRRAAATGLFLDRLYFITRAGDLWGVSAAALARINFRISTDERWVPESDSYLQRLMRWCQSLAEEVETPDVLQMYAATPSWGRQILVAGR